MVAWPRKENLNDFLDELLWGLKRSTVWGGGCWGWLSRRSLEIRQERRRGDGQIAGFFSKRQREINYLH